MSIERTTSVVDTRPDDKATVFVEKLEKLLNVLKKTGVSEQTGAEAIRSLERVVIAGDNSPSY